MGTIKKYVLTQYSVLQSIANVSFQSMIQMRETWSKKNAFLVISNQKKKWEKRILGAYLHELQLSIRAKEIVLSVRDCEQNFFWKSVIRQFVASQCKWLCSHFLYLHVIPKQKLFSSQEIIIDLCFILTTAKSNDLWHLIISTKMT